MKHHQMGRGGPQVSALGFGCVGLKLAKTVGAEVTLFSRSPGEEADALRLGAEQPVISGDTAQRAAVADRFHLDIDMASLTDEVRA